MPEPPADPIFNRHGRRHYRRTYSVTEVRLGAAILASLAAIAAWVVVRGQHPDPGLFGDESLFKRDVEKPADRGPLPARLTLDDYREGPITHFGPDNLFEKIDGRADFFKSRGFERLTFVSLQHADANRSVDLEVYDMGSDQNALGTYASERAPEAQPQRVPGAQFHVEPSAMFLARGRYYVRALSGSAAAPVPDLLAHLVTRLNATLPGSEAPWSEALFVGGLGLSADDIGFVTENAFSFGFARRVHTAALKDGETELFVVAGPDPQAAAALSARFIEGFSSYGEVQTVKGQAFVADRYLKRVSTAASAGALTFGVVAAADRATAARWLEQLRAGIGQMPAETRALALSEGARGSHNPEGSASDAPEAGAQHPLESSHESGQ